MHSGSKKVRGGARIFPQVAKIPQPEAPEKDADTRVSIEDNLQIGMLLRVI